MPLEDYEGSVESVLISDDAEILRDLVSVVEAALGRAFRLTKGGLPPKPLWSAVNDRLLWKDPASILDDWDEVDQIRFVYSLAMQLKLIQVDMDRNIFVGVGADRFFFASPTRRAAMLMRAWLEVEEWDERCDARNEYGHRYHFGQTFRRDFTVPTPDLRAEVLDTLRGQEAGVWFRAEDFALQLNQRAPGMLVADGDTPELPPDDHPDEEFERFVDYWLYQAARFGWVNLARKTDDSSELGARVFSITPLLTRLLSEDVESFLADDEDAWKEKKAFRPGAKGVFVLDRELADIGDEYLMRRLADPDSFPSWDEPKGKFLLTQESLEAAVENMINLESYADRVHSRCHKAIPATTRTLLNKYLGEPATTRLVFGVTAIELPAGNKDLADKITAAGFKIVADVALVPWQRWDEYIRAFGDPDEGFEYPTEEPLAHVHKAAVELVWPVLPLAGRDLLEALGLNEDATDAPLTEGIIETLGPEWNAKAVAEALRVLADDNLPAWLSRSLAEE